MIMEGCFKFEWNGKKFGAVWGKVVELLRPDLRRLPFLFLMKDFLMVIVRENGDSSILKFKFDFLIKFSTASLVWFASILHFLPGSELIIFY